MGNVHSIPHSTTLILTIHNPNDPAVSISIEEYAIWKEDRISIYKIAESNIAIGIYLFKEYTNVIKCPVNK